MKQYQLKTNLAAPQKLTIDYAKELNSEQLEVVKQGDGPCLVLAGAGSGKTRTLVYRVAWLLEHGVKPQNILLVTFTNKAAREMLERVKSLLKQEPKGLWGGTFHHIGNRILRQYIQLLGYQNNYAILDSGDAKELVAAALTELDYDTKNKIFPKADTVKAILSFAVNSQQPLKEVMAKYWRKFAHFLPQLQRVGEIYERKKKQSNVLDYDDLLVLWLRLLRQQPPVKERLSQQFHYILVDEYQDTNHIQAAIIGELSQTHNNVLVVGDDAQSIYSFRAADINNILDFPKTFRNAKVFKLVSNYRSTENILKLANASIKHNKKTFKKNLKNIRQGKTVKPGLVALADNNFQASFIVQRVLELKEQDSKLRDMAVLFRSSFQTLELEVELARSEVPYIKRGGIRYFEQAHIKDLVSYLKILTNPQDELAWRRILKLYGGVGDKYAAIIWQAVAREPVEFRAILVSPELAQSLPSRVQPVLGKLAGLLLEFDIKATKPELVEAMQIILKQGYKDILKNKFDDWQDRLEDLEQLTEFARQYNSIEEFLSDVALSEGFRGEAFNRTESDRDNDYLVLSTIHQAKGLEWSVVMLLGLVEGQFPHSKALFNKDDLEEERRLFYVAVTRAKDELYLTYPLTSFYGAQLGRTIAGPSRFIKELPEHVYEPWQVDSGLPTIDLAEL